MATELSSFVSAESLVRAIVERVQPSRVILFGSRARSDADTDTDFDIVVERVGELDALRDASRDAVRGMAAVVDIVVRAPGQIEARMHDVGYLDYDVAREGIVLYSAGEGFIRRHLPPVLRVREGIGRVPKSAEVWRRMAEADLANMDGLLAAPEASGSAACFHARQAAEKYLKLLLVQRNIRPVRTRDLVELVAAVRGAGYVLADVDAACVYLTGLEVGPRHPDDGQLLREDVIRAEQAARTVAGAVRPLVESREA